MKKWNLLETAVTPDGEELKLFEHDGDFVMRVRGVELMSTRQKASEEKLAEVGCVGLVGKKGANILIGGLGFGFTLRAVLSHVPHDAKVVVAELIPAVAQWNSNPKFPLGADAMRDARVDLRLQDVGKLIESSADAFDVILLDVDNGPSALTFDANHRLYGIDGVRRMYRALRPGGRACIWSIDDSPQFARLLTKNGFRATSLHPAAHNTSGGLRTIFVATRVTL